MIGAVHNRRRAPRGITLLEVLISLFVLTVGLLGMVILSTVGVRQLEKAQQLDQGAVVGRAAHRDLIVRGYMQPAAWAAFDTNTTKWTSIDTAFAANLSANPPKPAKPPMAFVIDPIMTADNDASHWKQLSKFPYDDPTGKAIDRLSLWSTAGGPRMSAQFADRIFRSADDLAFAERKVNEDRPTQIFDTVSNQPVARASTGQFTWFATVAPSFEEYYASAIAKGNIGNFAWGDVGLARKYSISIVVCDRRDFVYPPTISPTQPQPPAERIVKVDSPPTLGGEALLTTAGVSGATAVWLETLRPGQWIMLSGEVGRDVNNDGTADIQIPIIQWYRVGSLADVTEKTSMMTTNYYRYVTLQGPDWPSGVTTYATIVDGVIGVFQKDVRFEGRSLWSGS